MQDQSCEILVSPSFNSYSSDNIAQIASNVCQELHKLDLCSRSEEEEEDNPSPSSQLQTSSSQPEDPIGIPNDDEFEFVSLYQTGAKNASLFNGAPIGPVFPVFNRDLLSDYEDHHVRISSTHNDNDNDDGGPRRPSCSSSEADELERVPEGTYCVWTPKDAVPETSSRCKKSKSTGSSSKRWRYLKDVLLRRSNSESNKDSSFLLLSPLSPSSNNSKKLMEEKIKKLNIISKEKKMSSEYGTGTGTGNGGSNKSKVVMGKGKAMVAAHEAFYGRHDRILKQGNYKRRSFLPYRQDLFGFFPNVNSMGRTFPPF